MKRILPLIVAAAGLVGVAGAVTRHRTGPAPGHAPGPDSSQVRRFLGALESADPAICDEVADSYGNFWWGDGPAEIGALGDRPPGLRPGRDSLRQPVSDPGALRLLASDLGAANPCVRRVAAKMLGHGWPATRSVLAEAVRQSDVRVREAALLALGVADDSAARGLVAVSHGGTQ